MAYSMVKMVNINLFILTLLILRRHKVAEDDHRKQEWGDVQRTGVIDVGSK
jgi:hypothetical protein